MKKIVVVNNPKSWNLQINGVEVVSAKQYLTDSDFAAIKRAQVFNLCRNYKYQSLGYYVSLLAEARAHRVFPSVTTIQDFKSKAIIRSLSDEIDVRIQKSLARLKSNSFTLSIYFGRNMAKQYDLLSRALYNLFQAPLLRAEFVRQKTWVLASIQPISLNHIPESHLPFVEASAQEYFSKQRYPNARKKNYAYDLAILVNADEPSPPSDKEALLAFRDAADAMGFFTEFITKDDYSRLPEYDALFIRETTAVNHHTYRFARRAFSEGLVVIDDPVSILRCTNKVYLAELLRRNGISTPKSIIVSRENRHSVEPTLGFPCVLKQPDGSFSRGVSKVEDSMDLGRSLDDLLTQSELVLAQEFLPTSFDWRIGVLNGVALFACKYFMANDHWQIYDWQNKERSSGGYQTVPVGKVPIYVIQTALKAASLIGNGLYGVDVKEIDGRAVVIEVNDNPNIDADVEDQLLGRELYVSVMRLFKERLVKVGR